MKVVVHFLDGATSEYEAWGVIEPDSPPYFFVIKCLNNTSNYIASNCVRKIDTVVDPVVKEEITRV